MAAKQPFDIEAAIPRIREAVRPYPKAALFELAAEGHDSVFEVLVACVISIRTRDETTLPVARRLFAAARTPPAVAALSVGEIDELIRDCTFHEPKARQIHAIAVEAVERHGGVLPPDRDVLLGLRGVGPKCAALALGIAGGQEWIGVDIHVHRVTNRWGVVQARTPEETMTALERVLQDSVSGQGAALEPGLAERLHQNLGDCVSRQESRGEPAVLLVPGGVRAAVAMPASLDERMSPPRTGEDSSPRVAISGPRPPSRGRVRPARRAARAGRRRATSDRERWPRPRRPRPRRPRRSARRAPA